MAIPTLTMIPSGYKAGKLYSVLPTNGDGDFTSTRSTTATRVNKNGLIETVLSNVPRLDYSYGSCPSLLLEEQSTNKIIQSQDFGTSWNFFNGLSTSTNQSIAPDGTLTADKIISNGSNFGFTRPSSNPVVSIGKITFSLFAKADNETTGWLRLDYGTTIYNRKFNLTTQTFSNGFDNTGNIPDSEQIIDYGNGWFRLIITASADSTSFEPRIYLTGNTGASVNDSLFLWGAQIESGSYPSSYIPTSGSASTRNEDNCISAGNSSTINSVEGVLYAEFRTLTEVGLFRQINISKDSASRVYFSKRGDNGNLECRTENPLGGKTFSFNIDTTQEFVKVAFRYGLNNFAVFIDGVNMNVSSTGNTFPIDTLNSVDFTSPSNQDFFGQVRDLRVYGSALSNEELIQLTTI